jgi:AraC family transcriptional regulator, transcriptional activator of pobA
MHLFQNTDIPFLHFSFLKDIKVHGVYFSSLSRYLNKYPILRKEHIHDFYSVILFSGGSNLLKVNNDSYKVQPQSICLIPPNKIHSYEGLENMEGSVFLFCQDFYVEEFSYLRLLNTFFCTSRINGSICRPCINLSENEIPEINGLLKSIDLEYEHSSSLNDSAVIIRSLLNILLLKLSRYYHSNTKEPNLIESIFIHKISQLVDSYFTSEHNTGFYASAFNISEKRLNEICKKHFNSGLKNILTDRLMHEARKLLLTTELSVAEISFKLNFEDNSYFTKVFKRQTRLTPKKFRDLHKKLIP